jgi:glycosyltransferase involved in cell wall biosynthesis
MRATSVAFVVQRCADETAGGAESLCLRIAEHLNADLRIEILSTCARDATTWRNHFPAGHTHVRGVHVQRFPVDAPRDAVRCNALSRMLRERPDVATLESQEAWMRAQGPLSSRLTGYLRSHARRFACVAFFGYLDATSYFNLPAVAERALLWPFAHDEWPFALSMWDRFFAGARHIVYSSPEEQTLVERRFPNLDAVATLVSAGIRLPPGASASRFRERHDLRHPFALYLGRVEPSQGCDALVDHFRRYYDGGRASRKLLLIGDAPMELPAPPAFLHLGRVEETEKWDALAAADLVVVPSPHESFSPAALEAWAAGKAVLVNAASAALVAQCRRSNGGLWYGTYDEFAAALDLLNSTSCERLGAQGRAFVERQYPWDEATACYRRILSSAVANAA